MIYRPTVFATLLAFALSLTSLSAFAAPEAELWERWSAHEPNTKVIVDHSIWDRLLSEHIEVNADGVARFHYAALQKGGRDALKRYLSSLSEVPISRCSREEQFAFWVNLYNALTVQVIVDHYPVESIRDIDISPGLFSRGPWKKKLFEIEGEMVSLDDIEHRILRPIWKDPRIHYAVNCASIGCPDLMSAAFTANNAEKLLNEGARRFVNHPRGAAVENGKLVVSSIYEWFKKDFGGNDQGVIAHIKQHAEAPLRESLASISSINDDRYDWSLNETR